MTLVNDSRIPSKAVSDHIMASAQEIEQMVNWAKKAFCGECCGCPDDNMLIKGTQYPFSFKYGGTDSAALLPKWKHSCECTDSEEQIDIKAEWVDPETQLAVIANVKVFKQYPAVDWLLNFENRSDKDTPILEDVRVCSVVMDTSTKGCNPIVHQLNGDSCGEKSFAPYYTEMFWPGQCYTMAPTAGRPSNATAFPFFNFEYNNRGIITAIGWSGQWAASFKKNEDGSETSFEAGMELCHLRLHPGRRFGRLAS